MELFKDCFQGFMMSRNGLRLILFFSMPHNEKGRLVLRQPFHEKVVGLFHGIQNRLESRGIVHRKISKRFAVERYIAGVNFTHELRVRHSMLTGSSVNTLNPECTEVAFLGLAVAVCVLKSFFDSVFGNCPYVFAGTEITLGKLEDLFPLCL
jgi:hypothetical protein